MGRDWTPRELHWADKQFGFSKEKLTLCKASGEELCALHDPDSDDAKKYPNLYFLYNHEQYTALKKALPEEALTEVENALRTVIKNDDTGVNIKDWAEKEDTIEPLRTVCQWYLGKLDSCFYYSTENDNEFYEKLLEYYHAKP